MLHTELKDSREKVVHYLFYSISKGCLEEKEGLINLAT